MKIGKPISIKRIMSPLDTALEDLATGMALPVTFTDRSNQRVVYQRYLMRKKAGNGIGVRQSGTTLYFMKEAN